MHGWGSLTWLVIGPGLISTSPDWADRGWGLEPTGLAGQGKGPWEVGWTQEVGCGIALTTQLARGGSALNTQLAGGWNCRRLAGQGERTWEVG